MMLLIVLKWLLKLADKDLIYVYFIMLSWFLVWIILIDEDLYDGIRYNLFA